MSIYLITKRKDHLIPSDPNLITTPDVSNLIDYLTDKEEIGFDKEFSTLNVFRAIPLLTQFGDSQNQFVIDDTSIDPNSYWKYISSELLLIGHNIKIDYKIHRGQGLRPFRKVFDTMLAEQHITRGLGYFVNLNDTLIRRLNIMPLAKDVRTSFIGMNKRSKFTERHIFYAADDTKYLPDLKEVQQSYIDRARLNPDLYNIEFPLSAILADAELKGCALDEDKWKENIQNNKTKALKLENNLNNILIGLSGTFENLKKIRIKKETKKEQLVQNDLFGEGMFINSSSTKGVNYNSSHQVLNIFDKIGVGMPTFKDKGIEKDSVREEALESFLNDNRAWLDSRIIDFVDTLVEYKKTDKNITSFGDRFLVEAYKKEGIKTTRPGYKSLVTGKVHTIYRQCNTETTRMSSGDTGKKKNKNDPPPTVAYFNSQNIPKPNSYRHCFIADEGRVFTTADLSQAELRISASLSQDKHMLELVKNGDIHSTLASSGYNSIVNWIIYNMPERRAKEELAFVLKADYRLLECTEDKAKKITEERVNYAFNREGFRVRSKEEKDIRTNFKNYIYGLSYGAGTNKVMDVLNICKNYAEILIRTTKEELPDFFAYQDRVVKTALEKGIVRFHPNYGSRHLFKKVLEYKRLNQELPFHIKGEVERAAKNYPIQGIQGLMIKKATVDYFYNYVYPNNYDVNLIFQIHDENVIDHSEDELEHGKVLVEYMDRVANEFLNNIEMQSEAVTMKSWHK